MLSQEKVIACLFSFEIQKKFNFPLCNESWLLLLSEVEKWTGESEGFIYTLHTMSTWTIPICWGQVQLL